MLKDELDKHIKRDNNNNEDENIEDQWWIIKNIYRLPLKRLWATRFRIQKEST
jgi:hypothetical protein